MSTLFGRDPLPQGFPTDSGSCGTGDELANFATPETSSDQADFLGLRATGTDWTHCAASARGKDCAGRGKSCAA